MATCFGKSCSFGLLCACHERLSIFVCVSFPFGFRGGRELRWCWVNFPTIWISVEQGPTAPAVGAGGGCLDMFTLIYPFPLLSPSLWETARYRLKYCLKGPLSPKQPTSQRFGFRVFVLFIIVFVSNNCRSFYFSARAAFMSYDVQLMPIDFQSTERQGQKHV